PPSLPTSRPSTMTRGSASISSANALLIASTMLRCVISCLVPVEQLGLLPKQARRRVLIDVREDVLGSGCGGGARELERTVVLVHLDALEAISCRPQSEAACCRLDPPRRRDGPLVVLEEEDDRRLHDSRQVQRLVEIALRGAAVADVRDHDGVLPTQA